MQSGLHIERKIKALYPDLVKKGVQVRCDWDDCRTMWRVALTRGKYALKTILEKEEEELLLSGNRCQPLTVELQQLVESIDLLEDTQP
jgi:hypothetical protein